MRGKPAGTRSVDCPEPNARGARDGDGENARWLRVAVPETQDIPSSNCSAESDRSSSSRSFCRSRASSWRRLVIASVSDIRQSSLSALAVSPRCQPSLSALAIAPALARARAPAPAPAWAPAPATATAPATAPASAPPSYHRSPFSNSNMHTVRVPPTAFALSLARDPYSRGFMFASISAVSSDSQIRADSY